MFTAISPKSHVLFLATSRQGVTQAAETSDRFNVFQSAAEVFFMGIVGKVLILLKEYVW